MQSIEASPAGRSANKPRPTYYDTTSGKPGVGGDGDGMAAWMTG